MTKKTPADTLTRLKGIGNILAERLTAAGLGTFAGIAAATESKLAAIPGMNPRAVTGIIEQAATLASAAKTGKNERITAVKKHLGSLRDRFGAIAADLRGRYADELSGKAGSRISRDYVRIMDLLDSIEQQAHKRIKRTERTIARATRRCDKLATDSISGFRKGVKKMRKTLDKVLQ